MKYHVVRSARGVFVGFALVLVAVSIRGARGETSYESQLRELEVIRQRIIDERTLRHLPADSPVRWMLVEQLDREAGRLLAREGGYWRRYASVENPAISYNGAAWADPLTLGAAYMTPGSRYHGSGEVLRAIEAGLRHLLKFAYPDCPQPGNWWAWKIGAPRHLLTTLLLLEPELDRELLQKEIDTLVYLLHAGEDLQLAGPHAVPEEPLFGDTDTNSLWYEILRLELGILLHKPAAVGRWAHRSFGRIGPAGEGHLQADGSFKFHGPIPMWAYGEAFLYEYAKLVRCFRGTHFGPRPEHLGLFTAMATGYVEGFLYRGRIGPAMIGRTLTRGDAVHHVTYGPAGVVALASIIQAQGDRAGKLAPLVARERRYFTYRPVNDDPVWRPTRRALALALHGVPEVAPSPPPDDVFAYPDSDVLRVARPGWAVDIKMHSQRNRGYESINEENLQGWFLSHGSMFHFIDGREWDGCWPTLDWTRLPGTTVAAEVKDPNTSPFVGVLRASNHAGMAAMELRAEPFRARKSWVIHGDEIVCLGSEIAGPNPVETTVFNQPVPDSALLLIDGKPAPENPFEKKIRARWLWLEGVGYFFPKRQEVLLIRESRTSDFSSVRGTRLHGESTPRTHNYLTGVIRHDAGKGSYAYVFVPGVSADEMAGRVSELASRYVLDTAGPHRVTTVDQGLEAVSLWKTGRAGKIEANRGCMLLRSGSRWRAVDPAWTDAPLELRIGERLHRLNPAKGRAILLDD